MGSQIPTNSSHYIHDIKRVEIDHGIHGGIRLKAIQGGEVKEEGSYSYEMGESHIEIILFPSGDCAGLDKLREFIDLLKAEKGEF